MLSESQRDHIKDICGHLDSDGYGKQCNFLQDDEDDIKFYSRDLCEDITFRELLKWYLPRIHNYENENTPNDILSKYMDQKEDMFMMLVDLYAHYKMIKKING